MNKYVFKNIFIIFVLVFTSFLYTPSRVYAMASPPSYYYISSIELIFTMLLSDAAVLWLFLKTIKKVVLKKIFLLRLLVTFSFGVLADIFSLIITDYLFQIIFPTTARYHGIYLGNYADLVRPDRLYMLGTYLNNFTAPHPEYMQPFGIILLTLAALVSIILINFFQKWIFKLSYKEAILLAIVFGVLTNPVWVLYPVLVFFWIAIMLIWFVVVKKSAAKEQNL